MANVESKGFAIVPYAVMDSAPDDIKGAVFACYLVLHRRGWNSPQGCWSAVKTIQQESGFGRPGVNAALRWLVAEGWLTKEDRPGYTSVYRVRVEDPQPRSQATPSRKLQGSPRQKTAGDPRRKLRTPPAENCWGPPQKTAHEQEPRNKNPETRTHEQEVEPLVFPASGEPDRPGAAIVSAVPDPPPAKAKGNRKPAAFSPTAEDIDVRLLPVERQILAFWAGKVAGKKGATTKDAWLCLQTGLLRIQQDPEGGTHVVAEQLDAGIQAGWSSVTYANWQRYGKPARVRYGSQIAAGPNGEGLRGNDAFEFMRQELRRRQAQAEQEHTQPTMRYAG